MRKRARAALLVSAAALAHPALAADAPQEPMRGFIGAAAGTGTASFKRNGTRTSFSDALQGSSDETPFVAIKVVSFGVAVSPKLYAGADLTGVAQSGTVANNKIDLQINNYFATLTWFPWESGLYLKAAAGVSSFFIGSGQQSDRVWGPGGLVAVGVALRLSGPHHLTLSAEQAWQQYSGSGTTRPDSTQYSAAFVGYMWKP